MEMNLSLLLSAGLAVGWTKGLARGSEEDGKPLPPSALPPWAWKALMRLSDMKQVLPALFAAYAASSLTGLLYAAVTLGIPSSSGRVTGCEWLGEGDDHLGMLRRWSLLAAVTVWRAEKLESLLQRMQRSCRVVKTSGLGLSIRGALTDPMAWVWPAFWGLARRLALVAVSTFGSTPFLLVVLPAVVFDEFAWWILAESQNLSSKKGIDLPPVVNVLIFPILDLLHFVPVVTRVFFLAVYEYPEIAVPWRTQAMLVICGLAWTAHNCHTIYSTVCIDLPESARQLWAARSMSS